MTTKNNKAHINEDVGFNAVLTDYAPVPQQTLTEHGTLSELAQLDINLSRVLYLHNNIIKVHSNGKETESPTTNTIGLVLQNNKGEDINLTSYSLVNNDIRPVTVNSDVGAFIIGDMSGDSEWWCVDGIEEGIQLYRVLIERDNITVLVCTEKYKFFQCVEHFSQKQQININTTIDSKDEFIKRLSHTNTRLVITDIVPITQGIDCSLLIDEMLDGAEYIDMHAAVENKNALLKPTIDCDAIDGENLTDEQFEEIIHGLAELSVLVYERKRNDVAKFLNMRATVLDKLVNQARKEIESNGNDELIKTVTPHNKPVDAQSLLDEIKEIVASVVACNKPTSDTVALWIFFTWCVDAFDTAPIACITAPQKRCGKTVLLTLIGKMVRRPLESSYITAPALFRMIDKWQPTLLIDEADAFLKQDEDMRGVINLGHTKGKKVVRCTGDDHEPKGFDVFGAKAISGIGSLSETIQDRSIIFELQRKLPTETRLRLRDISEDKLQLITEKLARWSNDHIEQLKKTRVELPLSINDRSQDNWEGLLIIAKLISQECFNHYTQTAITLSGTIKDEPSISEQLLLDIKAILDNWYSDRVYTYQLIEKLCEDDEKPWTCYNFKSNDKQIKPSQLAKRLKDFGIKSKLIRQGGEVKRGYHKADFDDVFKRYTA